uniref:Uncharacterized protein n=1 Tax=Lactuca sativa TaxID=4236 RepID=A0A9R1X1J1_LACSA|nr:hypothetical protein LSAT_V11C700347730 [Lactuca sativa]
MLKWGIDMMRDDQNRHGVEEAKHRYILETHLYAMNYNFGSLVTSNWLAKHYLQDVIRKPKMTLDETKEDVLRRFLVNVSKGKC